MLGVRECQRIDELDIMLTVLVLACGRAVTGHDDLNQHDINNKDIGVSEDDDVCLRPAFGIKCW